MSKKTLLLGLAPILFFAAGARAVTYNIEFSVGGNSTDFPSTSKGFLIVDTAGDGFDFVTANSALIGKSDSKANEQWGDDDLVVFAGLSTESFPNNQRGFNILPTEVTTDKWKEGDKLALVWFPAGTSTAGSKFSYYTSDKVDHESGTIPFQASKNGATDSIVALGVKASTATLPGGGGGGATPPKIDKPKKGGNKGANKGGSSAQKSKGSNKGSAKKSSGSKKSSAKKSSGSAKKKSSSAKASKGNKKTSAKKSKASKKSKKTKKGKKGKKGKKKSNK